MPTNRNYKDSVFSLLFNDIDALRDLYSALEGVVLAPDTLITINTLADVLFMDMINDLSFMVDNRLIILVEHQSSINPNISLPQADPRLLLYIARVYEKVITDRKIYSVEKLHLPQPEFFVLYNGTAPYPDEEIIRLSDSFADTATLGLPQTGTPSLELTARVININQGCNETRVRRCKVLAEYSAFIAKVREFIRQGDDREAAMKQAIKYCREHDILKGFLETHSTEVFNMILTEWNTEDAKAVWFEDGEKKGRVEGREESARNFLAMGLEPEKIARGTGLSLETIKGIASTLGTQGSGY
ncbi:hypothetical protein FACS189461_1200 [Spirochaetia bacterium]|nr:hypothetical protein FACS189461_1200 [Spirochaetia bacterium]